MPICADFLSRSEMFTTCSNFISRPISHGIHPLWPKRSFRILINKTGHFRRFSFDFNLFQAWKKHYFIPSKSVSQWWIHFSPGGFRSPWSCLIFLPHERKRAGGSPIDGQWWQIAHEETDNWPFCSSWYWIIAERPRTTTGCVSVNIYLD